MESIFKRSNLLTSIMTPLKEGGSILESHLLIALYFFHENTQGGRYALSEFLNFNESRTRTIMNKLIDFKVINSSKGRLGSTLTDLGNNLCEKLFKHYKILNYDRNIDLGVLSMGKINGLIALPIVDNFEDNFDVLELRDSIIRNGTFGASIFKLEVEKGNFSLNFYQNVKETPKLDKKYQKAFNKLINSIKFLFSSNNEYQSWLLVAGTNKYEKNNGTRRLSKKSLLRNTIIATLQGAIDCDL